MSTHNLSFDDEKPYASSAERFQMMDSKYDEEQRLRLRNIPDVPQDVLIKEHFNDPNFNLSGKNWLASSEVDAESNFDSDRYSTDRPESRMSTVIEFDEYVSFIADLIIF